MRVDCQEEPHTEDAGVLQEGKRGNMSEGAHGFNEFSQGQRKGICHSFGNFSVDTWGERQSFIHVDCQPQPYKFYPALDSLSARVTVVMLGRKTKHIYKYMYMRVLP